MKLSKYSEPLQSWLIIDLYNEKVLVETQYFGCLREFVCQDAFLLPCAIGSNHWISHKPSSERVGAGAWTTCRYPRANKGEWVLCHGTLWCIPCSLHIPLIASHPALSISPNMYKLFMCVNWVIHFSQALLSRQFSGSFSMALLCTLTVWFWLDVNWLVFFCV